MFQTVEGANSIMAFPERRQRHSRAMEWVKAPGAELLAALHAARGPVRTTVGDEASEHGPGQEPYHAGEDRPTAFHADNL